MAGTGGKVVDTLQKAGIVIRCPICSSETLTNIGSEGEKSIALLYEDKSATWFGPPLYMQVKPLICDSCGYVLLFSPKTPRD